MKREKKISRYIIIIIGLLLAAKCPADTHYLVPANSGAQNPYTTWGTAGTSVIDVVKAAMANAAPRTVLVSNGVYVLTNSVVITNGVVLRSWNKGGIDRDGTILDGNALNNFTNHIWLRHGDCVLDGLTVTNCVGVGGYGAQDTGGGVNLYGGLVTNCLITGCRMTGGGYAGGGGILVSGTGVIANCTIRGNHSLSGGAGICIGSAEEMRIGRSRATVENCLIEENIIGANGEAGGGISLYRPVSTIVRNCLIRNNIGTNLNTYGMGISIKTLEAATNLLVANCTIVSNRCTEHGGGLFFALTTSMTNLIVNCIIISNVSKSSSYPNIYDQVASNKYAVGYSCSPSNTYFVIDERGNTTNDPGFTDFRGGNYRFNRTSPCFNSGTNQNWMTNAFDMVGRSRILHGRVDMGAYEIFFPSGTMLRFR